jgi:uncharacterized surface protein with fasciclin (FAS1) repeats
MKQMPQLSNFVSLIQLAGLEARLQSSLSSFSVFAPTNDGLERNSSLWRMLVAARGHAALLQFSSYHISTPALTVRELSLENSLQTLANEPVLIYSATSAGEDRIVAGAGSGNSTVSAPEVFVDNARLLLEAGTLAAPPRSENGLVHIVDRVLVPAALRPVVFTTGDHLRADRRQYGTLLAALATAGLSWALDCVSQNMTIFVSASAIDVDRLVQLTRSASSASKRGRDSLAALKDNLLNCLVSGHYSVEEMASLAALPTLSGLRLPLSYSPPATMFVGGAQLSTYAGGEMVGTNGRVYRLVSAPIPAPLIAEILETKPFGHSLLRVASLLNASSLLQPLGVVGGKPLTLFAPPDEAFESMAAQLDAWLSTGDIVRLSDLMRMHIVDAELARSSWKLTPNPPSRAGDLLRLSTIDGEALSVCHAKLLQESLIASNGVVHIIDAPLVPESQYAFFFTASGALVQAGDKMRSLLQPLSSAGLLAELSTSGPLTLFVPIAEEVRFVPRPRRAVHFCVHSQLCASTEHAGPAGVAGCRLRYWRQRGRG